MDGNEVIEHLGMDPGRVVGEAMKFLMEIRLEEGLIGDAEVRKRLDAWYRRAGVTDGSAERAPRAVQRGS